MMQQSNSRPRSAVAMAKQVRFGDNEESRYTVKRTEEERQASWYSSEQFLDMRCHAYGMAKTAVILGEYKRELNGNTLRGLEKMMPNKDTNSKRRRNLIRSIVQLHQMEISPPENANTDEIKATLKKYVHKHSETARKNAHKRAIEDEREASKIYYEMVKPSLKDSPELARSTGGPAAA